MSIKDRLDALEAKVAELEARVASEEKEEATSRYEQCVAFGKLLVTRTVTPISAPAYAICAMLVVLRLTGFSAADVQLLWNPLSDVDTSKIEESEAKPDPEFDLPPNPPAHAVGESTMEP